MKLFLSLIKGLSLLLAAAAAVIAVLFVVMGRVATGETSDYIRYAAVVIAVVIVALRAFARRRR